MSNIKGIFKMTRRSILKENSKKALRVFRSAQFLTQKPTKRNSNEKRGRPSYRWITCSHLSHSNTLQKMTQLGYLTPFAKEEKIKLSYYEPRFASLLKEKQKLVSLYPNMNNNQLLRFLNQANEYQGQVGQNLMKLLERRLDSILCRVRFASSIFHARQLINHGHVLVNGKVVNIHSFLIQDGDLIQLHPQLVLKAIQLRNARNGNQKNGQLKRQNTYTIIDLMKETHILPSQDLLISQTDHTIPYIEVDYNTFSCVYLFSPTDHYAPYFIPQDVELDLDKVIRYF